MKTRLQRFLADCGVASRRECEAMILGGRVRVNGQVMTKMPVMVEPGKDVITVDESEVQHKAGGGGGGRSVEELREQEKVYFLLNKPKGILVTNYDPSERKTVNELMAGVKERVFPVGRLEMDSRGALIMTNDGELANRLTHPRYGVEKVYIVEVDGRIGHDDLEKIKRGIWLGPDRPAGTGGTRGAVKTERFKIKLVGRERGRTILELNVAEGKNREIRRVMARIGHVVRDLNRVSIAEKITTKGLTPGEFRPLTEKEVKWLYHASSKEYHGAQQAETQAWYEAKEMEKERKRLEKEAAAAKLKPPTVAKSKMTAEEKRFKKFQERPERKGKKPFVPPTGRNAGIPLGGNFIGKQRLQKDAFRPAAAEAEQEIDHDADQGTERDSEREVAPKRQPTPGPKRAHPLGDAAKSDE